MSSYDHKDIEKKWQAEWEKNGIYKTTDDFPGKENFYLLVEFPYPSGNLHVGHWYAFAVPDILARKMRMDGKNVLYPIGFDAFGLPAENAAIKNKLNPRVWTYGNIDYMKNQIRSMGASFDWSREVITCDPEYYKWTQWLFLQFFKNDLVYQKQTAVNWCPKDKTVLANEQVIAGRCERCDSEVEQRMMLQWNIKITEYADRLIDDLEPLDWPQEIKESQKNWIGRSEGAEINFQLKFDGNDTKYNYILLHGKGGSPESDFWPWLKQNLERRGYSIQIPALPHTNEPNDEEQADYVQKNCSFDEHTILVGHSFGAVVALRLLERGVKADAATLIAMPFSGEFLDGKERPTVTSAVRKGFDAVKIGASTKRVIMLYDTGDRVVPLSDGEEASKLISAQLFTVKAETPHFNAAVEPEVLAYCDPTIRVFTTRPDTLFGATYLVLAPEHPWVTLAIENKTVLKNTSEVSAYVEQAKKKTELERMTGEKEKTGVLLEGVDAINPATGEKIPLYIADYVLANYGTGAIMAVPAHDDRDWDFAKKFDLPIRQVVAPVSQPASGKGDSVKTGEPFIPREAVMCIVKHWEKDEYLCLQWVDHPEIKSFVSGGIEKDEDAIQAGAREILEESGFKNARFVRQIGGFSYAEFYHQLKHANVRARFRYLYYELENGEQGEVDQLELKKHTTFWKAESELPGFLSIMEKETIWNNFKKGDAPYTGEGYLVDSGEFDGLSVADARDVMTKKFGIAKKTYRLRDWIVSRQRFWGVPIPIIHCEKCGSIPVPDEQLPVVLPEVEDYLPTGDGKSPLAKVKTFVEVLCPKCGGEGKRETDTFDTFVDSSWYFLRYTDPKNTVTFADAEKLQKWMPVDLYSGGAEHTTVHVLYSRFWQKALYDLGLVKDAEPYTRRMNRSLIMGPDGQKMSKSRGNVIDPDTVVAQLGADTVRMYLAFIGPYNEVGSYPWNPNGVVGVRRFIERVFRLADKAGGTTSKPLASLVHKTLKKVGEDILALKFNTAISQMMILLNLAEKDASLSAADWGIFLKMLAPFAPHASEELWARAGHATSVHLESWPVYDPALLIDEVATYAVQIDGKLRATIDLPTDSDKKSIEEAARESVAARLEGKGIARTVVVPNRLVNFVLE